MKHKITPFILDEADNIPLEERRKLFAQANPNFHYEPDTDSKGNLIGISIVPSISDNSSAIKIIEDNNDKNIKK